MIRIKKKNPHLEDIEEFVKNNSSKFRYLDSGVEGRVSYFKLDKKLVLNTEILKPGEYVLKTFHPWTKYNFEILQKFKLISKYGLIPKIFVITNKYIIMKYIKGRRLSYFWNNSKEFEKTKLTKLDDRVNELYDIWKKLGFDKYIDHSDENILVSEDLKHVYIIDPFSKE